MDIRYEKPGSAPVFVLDGRIDSAGSIQLDNAIKTRLQAADRFVVFDMTHVSYMSSAGIRVFSMLERVLRQKNGHLFLCALQPSVAKVLEITGFQRVFSVCATTAEAINRCQLEGTPVAAHHAGIVAESGPVRISIETVSSAEAVLKITGNPKKACAPTADPDDLTSRTFVNGEYSAGTGALGETAAEGLAHLGELVTLGGAIFWRPADSTDAPDFLVPGKDAPPVSLHTAFSVALDGPFHEIVVAEPQSPGGISLADL
ncbi:MAG: STAS domain-containing protein, partial [Methanoregula sp.]|nr:STAS domain-containing protein [Methanoregula sp.]